MKFKGFLSVFLAVLILMGTAVPFAAAAEEEEEPFTLEDPNILAKAALLGMTKSCAKELAARNITVNAVAPGFIETDMTASLTDEVRAEYAKAIPLKRMGTAQEVADAVAFLASDKAAYITGQVLAVNGGMYC